MAVNNWRYYTLTGSMILVAGLLMGAGGTNSSKETVEVVKACVIARDTELTMPVRMSVARCLGWQNDTAQQSLACGGGYTPLVVKPQPPDTIEITADAVSFRNEGASKLTGAVEVHESTRIVSADTAWLYRDAKTHDINRVVLLGNVRYQEPGRLMIARRATLNPQDKSGRVEDVLYRFDPTRPQEALPAWGRAAFVERFANSDYRMRRATWTTCAPEDRSWAIEAENIDINNAKSQGVARNARLRVGGVPVLYTPWMSFPTTKERKTGFLMPMTGYSNVNGFDLTLPLYLNLAPNYDATLFPHLYSERGVMMGGNFRYLLPASTGIIGGDFLPRDRAFAHFLDTNQPNYPELDGLSTNRWSFFLNNETRFTDNLRMHLQYQDVSDDYYLQDFSTNLSVLTERQLLRQGDVAYTTDHWLLRGMVQSFQTLQPVNQTPVSQIYERLPELLALGNYSDLPMNLVFNIRGQFDQFHWPDEDQSVNQGPRYYLNPSLALPLTRPWGYTTPSVDVITNYYEVTKNGTVPTQHFDRFIPRLSLDNGLFFERPSRLFGQSFTQTLEPRLYYLYVPFRNQAEIPVYDSGYMIFTTQQLFRDNRFSGFDRIADANQLAWGVTSRLLSDESGLEKASVGIGQIRYFSTRRVQICQSKTGECEDNPHILGYTSPFTTTSPFATTGMLRLNPVLSVNGGYVWDTGFNTTNNANFNLHYQTAENRLVNLGYTFLVNGDITQVANSPIEDNNLNQASFSWAWPLTDRWNSLGAYGYNISKGYDMLTFLGLEYDNCCWAMRLMGGRTFSNLNSVQRPQYNNHVFVQFLLKGLGSVSSSDPASAIRTYITGYRDKFHNG